MKVHLLTVSHRQPDWVVAAVADYQRRLPREWAFRLVELKPAAATGAADPARAKAIEAQRLQQAVPKGARLLALDEAGEACSSVDLARRIEGWQRTGRDLCFLVGGADGLCSSLLQAAEHRISLSALTLPHGLVRVLFVEQLYRAATLLRGHPYHRA